MWCNGGIPTDMDLKSHLVLPQSLDSTQELGLDEQLCKCGPTDFGSIVIYRLTSHSSRPWRHGVCLADHHIAGIYPFISRCNYIVLATLSIRETNSELDRVTQLRQSHVHVTSWCFSPHPISITSNPGYHVGDLLQFFPEDNVLPFIPSWPVIRFFLPLVRHMAYPWLIFHNISPHHLLSLSLSLCFINHVLGWSNS